MEQETIWLFVSTDDDPKKIKTKINKKFKVILAFSDEDDCPMVIYQGFSYKGLKEIERNFK